MRVDTIKLLEENIGRTLFDKLQEEFQDGGRVRSRDHLPLQKYIRNTSTCGTAPQNTY